MPRGDAEWWICIVAVSMCGSSAVEAYGSGGSVNTPLVGAVLNAPIGAPSSRGAAPAGRAIAPDGKERRRRADRF